MWIFTPDLFVSIVADTSAPDNLLVRARDLASLDRFLDGIGGDPADIPTLVQNGAADYRWRVSLPAYLVAERLAILTDALDYPNVKDAVTEPRRARIMSDVWRAALPLSDGPSAYYDPTPMSKRLDRPPRLDALPF